MLTLARALFEHDADLLAVIAAQWDIELTATSRERAAEELASAMARPEAVKAIWERLDDEQRKALILIQGREGRIPFSHFVRLYGEIRPMGAARREREKPWLNPASIAESLYYRGLIVRAFEYTPAGAQEYAVIPSDLRVLLPQPDPSETISAPGYPVAPPRKLKGGVGIAADDVATLMAYLRIRDIPAEDWLTNQPMEAIDRHLRQPHDPAYRAFLTRLLYELNLIADDAVLTHVVTRVNKEAARPWLEAPRLHQLRLLAETWLESRGWNDLAFTPGLEADEWPNDPRLARQAILAALRRVPHEIWWSLDGFIEHIRQENPDFQRPGGDYSAWYLRDAYSGEILHGFEHWGYIEGALIRFIIEGPMRWLGLIRAGRGAFLVTPLGRALLGQRPWPSEPDPEAKIRVDEQGVISVPIHLSRYDRLQIARFTAWISAPPPPVETQPGLYRDDGFYLYRLTPQALARAAAAGIRLDTHIIPFLQRLSGHTLPANVLRMLDAWQQRPGEVVVEDAVIITAKDLGVYERLRRNERVSRWLGRTVGPHAHVVRREHLPALLNALREMGLLPLFDGYEKDDWP